MAERRYPKADELRLRGHEVFSIIRQKWVQFTPEEKWTYFLHVPEIL
jgi:hypothetical protein